MKSSDSLFKLVKSFNKQEKRHARLFLARYKKENSKLVSLYDTLVKTRSYDEEKLKKKLKEQKMETQLSYYKNKLYHLLIRALCDYHYTEETRSKLMDYYKQASLLFDKKLYKEAEQVILKSKQEAIGREAFLEIIKFNRLYTWVLKALKVGTEYRKELYQLNEENEEALDKLSNYLKYEKLAMKAGELHMKYSQSRGEAFRKEVEELLTHPLLKNPDQALSLSAKIAYYQVHNTFSPKGDFLKNALGFKNIVNILESNSFFLAQRIHSYISAYINYITFLIYAHEFEEAEKGLHSFSDIPSQYPNLCDQWLLERHQLSRLTRLLVLYTESGQSEKVQILLPEIKAVFEINRENPTSLFNEAYMCFNLVRGLFMEAQYDACLHWIHFFFERFKNKDFTIAVRNAMQLIEILIHIDADFFSMAKSQILKLRRYFQETNNYEEVERVLISCLNKMVNVLEKSEKLPIEYLQNVLQKIDKSSTEHSLLFDFFTSYLKGKIEGKTFKTIMKEKIGKA